MCGSPPATTRKVQNCPGWYGKAGGSSSGTSSTKDRASAVSGTTRATTSRWNVWSRVTFGTIMKFSYSGNAIAGSCRNSAVSEREGVTEQRWRLRTVPDELVEQYVAEGWWTDASLGTMVADGLAAMSGASFRVRSKVRPWSGTFADVDRAARSLAASLQARGVGAGDVVLFQLPNWVEAGITFWASAYLGAVVVPVVHFYGSKEIAYILRATNPDVIGPAAEFGHVKHLDMSETPLADRPEPLWLVVGETPDAALPA